MIPSIIQSLENELASIAGSMTLVAIVIMIVFLIGFLFLRIDFKFAVLFVAPLGIAFTQAGWFPSIVGLIFWIFIVVYGGLLVWKGLSETSYI